MLQEIFVYLDDSGVLHKNSKEQFFVYAGYIFLSREERNAAKRKYRGAVRKLQNDKNIELKASGLSGSNKRFLLSQLAKCESLGCIVDKNRIYSSILDSKKSIHRYKDYCLKRAVKMKLQGMVSRKMIDPKMPTILRLFVDNQPTSTDGVYNLKETLFEEFRNGIINFDYGTKHPALFDGELDLEVQFCDSRYNTLVQASDMLANSIFTRYNYKPKLKNRQMSHNEIHLP